METGITHTTDGLYKRETNELSRLIDYNINKIVLPRFKIYVDRTGNNIKHVIYTKYWNKPIWEFEININEILKNN